MVFLFLKNDKSIFNSFLKLLIDINLVEKENEKKWKRFGLFIFQPFIRFLTFSTKIDINRYRLLIVFKLLKID